MQYSNPMGGLANPTDFSASPFLQAQQAYLKNDLAMPLIQAQQKTALMDGLQNAQKISEFMSPEQRQVRSAEQQDKLAGFQHNAAKRPLELQTMDVNNKNIQGQIEDRAERLRVLLRNDKAAPARRMYELLGQQSLEIAKLPPQAQPMAYQALVQQIQQETGQELPESLRTFSANTLQNGLIARIATENSPENSFRAKQGDLDRANRVETANISANASRYSSDRSAEARVQASTGGGTGRENLQQQAARLRTLLSNPDTPAAERGAAMEAYRALRITEIQDSTGYQNLATIAAMNPSLSNEQRQRQLSAFVEGELGQDRLLQGGSSTPRNSGPVMRFDGQGNLQK